MLVSFEKNLKNKEISKILFTILKVFKKNLEILNFFNKMYSIMHAFHWFFQEKHCPSSLIDYY